jgi:restriction system protein
MPIPSYEEMMQPLLQILKDKKEHKLSEITERISAEFNLTESEKKELLPSGSEPVVGNRVRWARLYLEKAGLLESTKKGFYKITNKGTKVLQKKPTKLDVQYLKRFPDFLVFKEPHQGKETIVEKTQSDSLNPMELFENAYQRIRDELSNELLREVKDATPSFLETLVIELLVKMGYGGSRKDAGQAIGRSGDGGIDGIIKEDRLGLDAIYIQAKKWQGTVSRPEIQKFVGALKGQCANKGIFITTSSFTADAVEYALKIEAPKIVLIDGQKLAELMIEHSIGVSEIASYSIKKIDSDYFSES